MVCPPVLSVRAAHIAADLALLWLQLRESAQQAQQAAAAGAAGAAAAAPITPSWCALRLNFPQAAFTTDQALHQQLMALEPPQLTAALLSMMPCPIPVAMPQLGARVTAAAAAGAAVPQPAASEAQARPAQQKRQNGQQQQQQQQQQQPPAKKAKSAAHANGR